MAQQVVDAAHATDPYHRAEALAEFLRSGPDFTYATQVSPPDPGHDLVDSFLFDTRAGYCEYFASAMAVMARSVGLPARVAVGFAPGEVVARARVGNRRSKRRRSVSNQVCHQRCETEPSAVSYQPSVKTDRGADGQADSNELKADG